MKNKKRFRLLLFPLTVFIGLSPILILAYERDKVQAKVIELIQNYYSLYNKLQFVEADDIVDQRLKNVNDLGTIQQFLVKDAVIEGARRLEHYYKYHSDHYYTHTPTNFHMQTTNDLAVVCYHLKREKFQKEDDFLIETIQLRVTWVFKQKRGEWVVVHEHQSELNREE